MEDFADNNSNCARSLPPYMIAILCEISRETSYLATASARLQGAHFLIPRENDFVPNGLGAVDPRINSMV
jgi:hypothetical protein